MPSPQNYTLKVPTHADEPTPVKFFWVIQILYKATINMTKISILCLYARIFTGNHCPTKCYLLILFIALWMFGSIQATAIQCSPYNYAWNKSIKGHCMNLTLFWYLNGAYNLVTDILILLLPMREIFRLTNLTRTAKINLVLIFSMGWL